MQKEIRKTKKTYYMTFTLIARSHLIIFFYDEKKKRKINSKLKTNFFT